MMSRNRYIFGGTRLLARLSQRLSERDWQRFSSIHDPQHMINSLQQTGAAPWVRGMDAGTPSEQMEKLLKLRLTEAIESIAAWYPHEWRAAIRWTALLPWLDTFRGLHTAASAGSLLRLEQTPFDFVAGLPAEARLGALRETPYVLLLHALTTDDDLLLAWYDLWRRRWPPDARHHVNLLKTLTSRFILAQQQVAGGLTDPATATEGLSNLFHQHAFSPVGVFAYLALQTVELIAMRQLLLDRQLFSEGAAA